jgi:hypothetical protein
VSDIDGGTDDNDSGKPAQDSGTTLDSAQQADGNMGMDTSMSSCASTFSGTLATFDFTTETGNQASTAAKTTAPNVMASAFTRSMGLTATTGAGSINSSNWPTSTTVDPTKYYAFTITPPAGCALDITQLGIDSKTSGTGPISGAVATSVDNFAATASLGMNSVAMVAVSAKGSKQAVEVRLYGYSASATGGTFRIQNTFTVTGALN